MPAVMDNAVFMVDGTLATGDGQCCIDGRLKPCYAPANPAHRHRSLLDR